MNNFEIYSLVKSINNSDGLVNTSSFDTPAFRVGDTITINVVGIDTEDRIAKYLANPLV